MGSTKAATWTLDQQHRREQVEAGQAVLANLRTDHALVQWARDTGRFVYIGRAVPRQRLSGSRWCNPVRVQDGPGDTQEARHLAAVQGYAQHLAVHPELAAAVTELHGKVLGCWCYPQPCHGQLLLDQLARVPAPPAAL